ncbi:hypothetical protein [Sinorhizobium fredii]|uniref:hypothetical protein n=1 Tax=Rhizobium fredii TaxID=380 RepID=UPI0005654CAF|nr:hypothetical protein [Sinorhizobium fredii]
MTNDKPLAFRDGRAFYDKAQLDEFDAVTAARLKEITDAQRQADRLIAAFERLEKQREKAKKAENVAEAERQRHELFDAEHEAWLASMSQLAEKYVKEGLRIAVTEGQDAADAWLAGLNPEIREHVKSEAHRASAKVWPTGGKATSAKKKGVK